MIIGLSGKKRSGKDTAYAVIRDYYSNLRLESPNIGVFRYAFADLVKEYAKLFFGIDPWSENEDKEKIRFVLQGIGQMMRETVDREFWVKKTYTLIGEAQEEFFNSYPDGRFIAIITDVRYRNEATFIEDNKGIVIRIDNPRVDTTDRHPSETDLDEYDFTYLINNDGTMEQYQRKLMELIWKLQHQSILPTL